MTMSKNYLEIDRTHPLANQLAFCFPLVPGKTGGTLREHEIIQARPLTDAGLSANNVRIVQNAYQFHNNSTTIEAFKIESGKTKSIKKMSLFAWLKLEAYSTGNYQGAFSTLGNSTVSLKHQLHMSGATGANQLTCQVGGYNGATYYNAATGLVVPLNEWCLGGFTYEAGVSLTSWLYTKTGGLKSFSHSGAVSSTSVPIDYSNVPGYVGYVGNNGTARCWRGEVKHVRIWAERILQRSEIQTVANDPDILYADYYPEMVVTATPPIPIEMTKTTCSCPSASSCAFPVDKKVTR